jgi:hypothetical protein
MPDAKIQLKSTTVNVSPTDQTYDPVGFKELEIVLLRRQLAVCDVKSVG